MLNRNDIINATHGGLDIFATTSAGTACWQKVPQSLLPRYTRFMQLVFRPPERSIQVSGFSGMKIMQAIVSIWWRRYTICRVRKADDFVEILRIINRDLCLGLSDEATANKPIIRPRSFVPEPARKTPTPYKFRVQTFSDAEQAWWKQYGINAETLNRYGVVSLAEYCGVSNSGHPYTLRSSPSNPCSGMYARME